jgi:hypothetical protein
MSCWINQPQASLGAQCLGRARTNIHRECRSERRSCLVYRTVDLPPAIPRFARLDAPVCFACHLFVCLGVWHQYYSSSYYTAGGAIVAVCSNVCVRVACVVRWYLPLCVLTQDMNADLTADMWDPFYRPTLVYFGHYASRANDWQPLQIVPKNALEQ